MSFVEILTSRLTQYYKKDFFKSEFLKVRCKKYCTSFVANGCKFPINSPLISFKTFCRVLFEKMTQEHLNMSYSYLSDKIWCEFDFRNLHLDLNLKLKSAFGSEFEVEVECRICRTDGWWDQQGHKILAWTQIVSRQSASLCSFNSEKFILCNLLLLLPADIIEKVS